MIAALMGFVATALLGYGFLGIATFLCAAGAVLLGVAKALPGR